MVLGVRKRAVGIFSHRRDAEDALHELKNSGFAMDRVSVIAQDTDGGNIAGAEVHEKVGNKADEGASLGAVSGGTLGGLTGLLVGLGTLAIPGIGPIMLAGATATAIATTLAGAGIGAAAGSLLGGLVGLGIPEEEARSYNERVERGHYLVIVDGSDAEISTAEAIMRRRGIEDFAIYDQANDSSSLDYETVGAAPLGVVAAPVVSSAVATSSVHSTTHRRRAIGVFEHRRDAEAAVNELRNSGFASDDVSIIGKDAGNNLNANVAGTDLQGNKADDGAKAGAATGAALGGLGGLLVGLGALAIPGVGPVLLGGAAATALATAATGAGIGAAAGGVTGGLVGLGIPENQARAYSDRLNRGDYIVIVDGTDDEIRRAETILKRYGIQDFDTYDATDISSHRRETPVMDTSRTSYSTNADIDSQAPVVIIDRRDETV
jgi:hypothetical protein